MEGKRQAPTILVRYFLLAFRLSISLPRTVGTHYHNSNLVPRCQYLEMEKPSRRCRTGVLSSSALNPSPIPVRITTPPPVPGIPVAAPQPVCRPGTITPTGVLLATTPPVSPGTVATPETSMAASTAGCQAPGPLPTQVASAATNVAVHARGCVPLAIAEGKNRWFDTRALVANPPAWAGAFATFNGPC